MSTAVRTNATSRPNAPMQHHGRITPMATFLQYLGCIELVKIIRSLSRNGLIHPGDLNDIDVCDIPELIAELKKDGINIGDRNRIRRHCTAIAFNFQPSAPATGRFIAGSAPATASGPTRAVSTAPVLLPNKPTLSPLQLANAALEGAQRGTSAAASASSAKPHPAPVLNINYAKTPAHAPATPHKAAASSSSSQGTSTAPSGGPRTGKRMKPERCKACGQTDHVRRTRTKCPAHPDYNPKDYTLESKLYKSTLDAASAFAADENLLHPPPRGNWGKHVKQPVCVHGQCIMVPAQWRSFVHVHCCLTVCMCGGMYGCVCAHVGCECVGVWAGRAYVCVCMEGVCTYACVFVLLYLCAYVWVCGC
eukprot:m.360147 g.360147  ORF g.360147 m.360147 type:complete len:364 (+) comp20767_c0_seq28:348-1439(+)